MLDERPQSVNTRSRWASVLKRRGVRRAGARLLVSDNDVLAAATLEAAVIVYREVKDDYLFAGVIVAPYPTTAFRAKREGHEAVAHIVRRCCCSDSPLPFTFAF